MPGAGRLGDKSEAPADSHGCPSCPHPAAGAAVSGSANVLVNFRPALRVGDQGVHSGCCGPNTWTATKGASTVFINGKPAHRLGDAGQHCGGAGKLIEGSPDVIIGDAASAAVSRRLAAPLLPVPASQMPAVKPLMAGMVFVNVDPSLVNMAIEIAKNPKGALGELLKSGVHLGLDRLGERIFGELYHTMEAIGRAAWKVLREVPFVGDYLKMIESYANNFFDALGYYITDQVPAFDYAPPGTYKCPGQLPISDYILLDNNKEGEEGLGLWRWPGRDVTYPLAFLLDAFAPDVYSFGDDAPPVSIRELDDGIHGMKASNGNLDINDDYARNPALQIERGPYLSAWKLSNRLIQIEVGFLRAVSFHPCSRPDEPLNYEHESDGERAYIYVQIDEVDVKPDDGCRWGVGRIIGIVGTGHRGKGRMYTWDKLNFRDAHPQITISRGSHATGITIGLLPTTPGGNSAILDYYAGPGIDGVRFSTIYQIADEDEAEYLYVKYAGNKYGNHAAVGDCYSCWTREPAPKDQVPRPQGFLPPTPSKEACPQGPACPISNACRTFAAPRSLEAPLQRYDKVFPNPPPPTPPPRLPANRDLFRYKG